MARPNESMIVIKDMEGMKLYSWNALEDCKGRDCVAYGKCKFMEPIQPVKCKAMWTYMDTLTGVIMGEVKQGKLNEEQLYRVGMHLMPLYRILCKLKIQELGLENIMVSGEKGGVKVHPIYREIRDTIRTISSEWSSVGIPAIKAPDMEEGKGRSEALTYYDEMEKAHRDELKVAKRRLIRR